MVIGSGIAGLFAALRLDEAGHEVVVITKQRPKDSSTNWAQGGIAGILDKTDGEGKDAHISDTLEAGDGLCDESVVRLVVEEAGDRIRDLLEVGVEFEKDGDEFHLVKEGAIRLAEFYTQKMPQEQKSKERLLKRFQKVKTYP